VISMLLAGLIAAPSYTVKNKLSHHQIRARAHQIVQMLKRQDPRVLRSVMYYMKWVPKVEFTRENCRKTQRNNNKDRLKKINDWEIDMLLDAAGIPKPSSGPRSR
jgi:hypothetical protein